MENGQPVVIENSEGARTTPSVVAFTKNGERLIGQAAKRQAGTNAANTISFVKRFMGRTYDEVQHELPRVPYNVVKSEAGYAHIQVIVNGKPKLFSPQEISAMILARLKSDAEAKLGEKITQAIISVPAYFNDVQRAATKDAGKIAGLEVLRIINEPAAASLAYGLGKQKDATVAFYDLGGGNTSISIVQVGGGVFEVKATKGDTHLGGEEWDKAIMEWILEEFKTETGIDLANQKDAIQRIREEAEKAKIALSSSVEYEILLPFISTYSGEAKHIWKQLTRTKLENLTEKLFARTIASMEACLKDAGLERNQINEVVLIGGMTRMPKVIETVRSFLRKEPIRGVNQDEGVAIGAAIQAGTLTGEVKDVLLLDVIPLTLALEVGGVATSIIPRNTIIPTRKSQIFSTSSDFQTSLEIVVLQGERPLARDNLKLGTFCVEGIPPQPKGMTKIEVTFDVDANGILHVSAKDLATGKEQKATITANSGLSKKDLEHIQREAYESAEEATTIDWNKRGCVRAREGAYEEALAAFRMGAATSPADCAYAYNIAWMYEECGRFLDAYHYCAKILRLNKKDDDAIKLRLRVSAKLFSFAALNKTSFQGSTEVGPNHYINPYSLLNFTADSSACFKRPDHWGELVGSLIRRNRIVKAEIKLNDGQLSWLPELFITDAIIHRMVGCLDDNGWHAYHWTIFCLPLLNRFLMHGDLEYFYSVDQPPYPILAEFSEAASEGFDHNGFITFLAPFFSDQWSKTIKRALDTGNFDLACLLFSTNPPLQPTTLDKAFEPVRRHFTTKREALRATEAKVSKRKNAKGCVQSHLASQEALFLNSVPKHLADSMRDDLARAYRSLCVTIANKCDDFVEADLALKAAEGFSVTLAVRKLITKDRETVSSIIESRALKEKQRKQKLTLHIRVRKLFRDRVLEITPERFSWNNVGIASAEISAVRYGWNTKADSILSVCSSNGIIISTERLKEEQFLAAVQSVLGLYTDAVVAQIQRDLERPAYKIGPLRFSKQGILIEWEGSDIIPWHDAFAKLVASDVKLASVKGNRQITLSCRENWNVCFLPSLVEAMKHSDQ